MGSNDALQCGDLVGLSDGRGHSLAVVLHIRGKRVELSVGHEGRLQTVASRDLQRIAALPAMASSVPTRLGHTPWSLTPEALAGAFPSHRDFAQAWLLWQEVPQATTAGLDELASLLGDGDDPALLAACWLWLQGGQTLFRWRQQRIEARNAGELRQVRQERYRHQLQKQREAHWRQALVARQPLDLDSLSEDERQQVALLRRWASADTDQALPADLLRLLRDAHCDPQSGAIRHLLVDLGLWDQHHLPSLEASVWQLGFSQALLEEARRLVAEADQPQPSDARRLDLTAQRVLTIDDEDTKEIDDGVALETMPSGSVRLWIHIADPGRLITPGSPLDLEARRRGSSLYLACGTLPMFPPLLAHGPMSLRQGERSAAWSLWVDLDEAGAVRARGVERSWIRPTYRLSYADADELIELAPPQEAELLGLQALLSLRRQWRLAQGALLMDDPEGRIRCRDGVAEVEIVEPSSSRSLVAEAMVLAGAVVADLGREAGVALPFRSQPPSDLPTQAALNELSSGPVRHAAIKRCLSRGLVGTSAAPHFSLGLAAYVQATSPIRRYGDLLAQRQLEALRFGGDPLEEAALGSLLQDLEPAVRQAQQISREDQRHWLQVWVERESQRQWPGLFLRWLRQEHQLGLVWIEDIAQSLPCACPPRSEPGDALLVRVVAVDSLRDELRLEATG